ncbi:MAG: exonuclease subunit SbcD, partial [Spirochaetales bacterium]|nr:exonuclease subunit SbcD [Spirochaetales bacterium]
LISGDVFDRLIPSENTLALFGRFLADLRAALSPEAHIVVLPGNHDSARRLAYAAELFWPLNIHLIERIDTEPAVVVEREGRRLAVWAVPFVSHSVFEAFRQRCGISMPADSDAEETGRKRLSQQAYFEAIMESIRSRKSDYDCSVLAAHCYVAGAQISETETSCIGGAEAVSAETFDGFDYVALGHLHRMQEIAPGTWYSGALLAMDFSEGEQQKGFLHVKLNPPETPCQRTNREVTFLSLEPRKHIKRLKGTLQDLLERGKRLEQPDMDYIEAYLTDERQIFHAFDDLASMYPNLLSLRWEIQDRRFLLQQSAAANEDGIPAGARTDPALEMSSRDRCLELFRSFAAYVCGHEVDPEILAAFTELLDEEVQA